MRADEGVRFENAVACMLLKHVHYRQDARGFDAGLHYLRTKDGAEVDFCLSGSGALTHLIECKLTDAAPHRALVRFATQFVQTQAVQLVHTLRHNESRPPVHIEKAAPWLMRLAA